MSSINKITLGLFLSCLFKVTIRSSNMPRNCVPATNSAGFSFHISLFLNCNGTLPVCNAFTKPITHCVFPTPCSPIKSALLHFLRPKTLYILFISFSRPTKSSISLLSVNVFKLVQKSIVFEFVFLLLPSPLWNILCMVFNTSAGVPLITLIPLPVKSNGLIGSKSVSRSFLSFNLTTSLEITSCTLLDKLNIIS